MRPLWTVLLCATFILASSHAFADTVALEEIINGKPTLVVLDPGQFGSGATDPRIRIRRLHRGSTWFWGLGFSFDLSGGTGQADFFNAGAATLYGLTLTIMPGGPASDNPEVFSCSADSELEGLLPFTNCLFKETGGADSRTVVKFYGGPGLPRQSHFSVELGGFDSNVQVIARGDPNPVPEPGTLALFLGGAALLLGRRRSRKSRCA